MKVDADRRRAAGGSVGQPGPRPVRSELLADDELLDRAAAGDREAFGCVVERHRGPALRFAYAMVGDDAEDVVQDAFVKAHRALPRFRRGAPFRPWLLAIVANEARNRRRSAGRAGALALRVASRRDPGLEGPEDRAISLDQRRRLLRAVAALDDRDREIVALRFFAGLNEAEAAAALGSPVGTAKSRLSRALVRLRTTLEEET